MTTPETRIPKAVHTVLQNALTMGRPTDIPTPSSIGEVFIVVTAMTWCSGHLYLSQPATGPINVTIDHKDISLGKDSLKLLVARLLLSGLLINRLVGMAESTNESESDPQTS